MMTPPFFSLPAAGMRRRDALCKLAALGVLPLAQAAAQAQTHAASAPAAAPAATSGQVTGTQATPPRHNFEGGSPERIEDPRVSHFELSSSRANELPWRIELAKPAGPAPSGGYRALYLLDGNATFPMAWHALERLREGTGPAAERAAQTVLIGLGYPADVRFDVQRRFFDYTPPTDPATLGGRAQTRTGGQDVFLDFVEHDVRAAVAQQLPLNPQQHGLYGHSLGGLLCLYALYTRPRLFQTWVAADPSIWWNGGSLLRQEAAFLATLQVAGNRLAQPMQLLIERSSGKPRARAQATAVTTAQSEAGQAEGHTRVASSGSQNSENQRNSRDSVPASQALDSGKALAGISGMQVMFYQFEDESHPSMIEPSIQDALGFFLGAPPPHLQRL